MGVRLEQDETMHNVYVSGELTRQKSRELYELMLRLAQSTLVNNVSINLSQVTTIDSAGVVTVLAGSRLLEERNKSCSVVGVSEEHAPVFAFLGTHKTLPQAAQSKPILERLGEAMLSAFAACHDALLLVWQTVRLVVHATLGKARLRGGFVIEQAVVIGVDALFIVVLLGGLIG